MADYTDNLNLKKWDLTNDEDLSSSFDISGTLNDNWDKVDEAVGTNSTNIATNTTNIATNTTNISTLETSVETNTEDIEALEEKVATNTTNIATNTTNIATNTANIEELQGTVGTNTENITTNTDTISNLQTELANKANKEEWELVSSYTVTEDDITEGNKYYEFSDLEAEKVFIDIQALPNESRPGEMLLYYNSSDKIATGLGINADTYSRFNFLLERGIIPETIKINLKYNINQSSASTEFVSFQEHIDYSLTEEEKIDYIKVGTWIYPMGVGSIINVYRVQ